MFELFKNSTGVVFAILAKHGATCGEILHRAFGGTLCGVRAQDIGGREHLSSSVAHGSTAGVWHFMLVTKRAVG